MASAEGAAYSSPSRHFSSDNQAGPQRDARGRHFVFPPHPFHSPWSTAPPSSFPSSRLSLAPSRLCRLITKVVPPGRTPCSCLPRRWVCGDTVKLSHGNSGCCKLRGPPAGRVRLDAIAQVAREGDQAVGASCACGLRAFSATNCTIIFYLVSSDRKLSGPCSVLAAVTSAAGCWPVSASELSSSSDEVRGEGWGLGTSFTSEMAPTGSYFPASSLTFCPPFKRTSLWSVV